MTMSTTLTRQHEDLMNAIAERLWRYEPVRSRDLPLDLSLSEDGILTVQGYAPTLTIKEAILDIVGSVAGVREVEDEIVADPSLEVAIAEELTRNDVTKHLDPGAVQIFAQVGNVVLVGDLPTEDREAVIQVVEGLPGVRQVVDRMEG